MPQIQSYQGIERSEYPDWIGWVIVDMLNGIHNETDENIAEIKRQLEFEVRMLKSADIINSRLIPDYTRAK